jgi:hypothetical protein
MAKARNRRIKMLKRALSANLAEEDYAKRRFRKGRRTVRAECWYGLPLFLRWPAINAPHRLSQNITSLRERLAKAQLEKRQARKNKKRNGRRRAGRQTQGSFGCSG